METRQLVNLEIKKDGNIYALSMPMNGTYGAAIDALFEMLQEAHRMQAAAIEKSRGSQQETPQEPVGE